MTDEPETPGISAEDEERVRHELAAASGAEVLPPDVAARLDDALAGLVRERAGEREAEAAPPTRLEPRRRGWPTLLVAAAAVAVLVLGIGTLLTMVNGPEPTGQGSGSQAASAPQRGVRPSGGAGTSGSFTRAAAVARLRSDTFQRDVQRLSDRLAVSAGVPDMTTDGTGRRPPRTECRRPPLPTGARLLRVTLDGRPASLVLGRPRNGFRVARAYSCDDVGAARLSARVRAR